MKQDQQKKLAAEEAVKWIKDGMVVGLGSGSTVNWMLEKLGEKVQQGLQITGIPSSKKTERLAKQLGIPLTDFSSVSRIDIAIDGADEVDRQFNLIKGGGGSLVREKIVDAHATEFIVIVDESKLVSTLGKFPLPVEVLPFGWELTARAIAELGCEPKIRERNGERFISDNGNYILDCQFNSIQNPQQLHEQLKQMTGVVETGLFVQMADRIIIGKEQTAEEIVVSKDESIV